jgi:hypothetical protein
MKVTSALVGAYLITSAIIVGGAAAAPHTGIDVVEPPAAGGGTWDGDRMRGARERVKDILPGRRD